MPGSRRRITPAKTPVALPRSAPGSIPASSSASQAAFQQQPLLGVHRQRLARGDAEEVGVEVGRPRRGSRRSWRRLAGRGRGRGHRGARGPSRGRSGRGRCRRALREQLPEALGRGGFAGEAAAHADDRDRLLAALGGVNDDIGAGAAFDLGEQVAGGGLGGRVVEDDGRLELHPGGLGEAVSQLDGAERVKAEVLEGGGGVDRLRGGVAEHGGGVLAHQREDDRLALLGRGRWRGAARASPRPRASAGRRPRGGSRRAAAGARRWPRSAGRRAPGAGPAPAGMPWRLRGRAAPGPARGRAGGAPCGRGARGPPARPARSPGAHIPQAIAVAGSPSARRCWARRVEEGVGGGVVALARGAEGGGGRGVEDEGGKVQLPGRARAGSRRRRPWGRGRWRGARGRASRSWRLERPGGVDDGGERVLVGDAGNQRLDLRLVGDVAGERGGLAAELGQLGDQLLRAGGLGAAAAAQQQMLGPVSRPGAWR